MNLYSFFLFCTLVLAAFPIHAKSKSEKELTIGMIHCCIQPDVFMWSVAEKIRHQAEKDGVKIIFINAEGNQQAQLQALNNIQQQNIDALLMSIVIDDTLDKPFQKLLIDTLKDHQLPVVFYLLAVEDRFLQDYKQAYRVGSIPAQSGILQGEMVSKKWLENPHWDTNGDGIMQYAILKGPAGNPDAEGRTKWIKATLATFPVGNVAVEEVTLATADFDRQKARKVVNDWVKNGTMDSIEVIIANNDDMILGTYDVLKQSAYRPALFGIDAIPEVIELIKQDQVAGTILQDVTAQSIHAYRLAVNLAAKHRPERGLDYPLVRQELILPYVEITKANVHTIK